MTYTHLWQAWCQDQGKLSVPAVAWETGLATPRDRTQPHTLMAMVPSYEDQACDSQLPALGRYRTDTTLLF